MERRSMVVPKEQMEFLGTRCSAAGHGACCQGLMNPISSNSETYWFKNFHWWVEYLLTFTQIRGLVGSSLFLMSTIFVGPPV